MRHRVRAEYLRELVRFVAPEDPRALVGDDFPLEDLEDGERMIDGPRFFAVLERAAAAANDGTFGWRLGWQLGSSKHGFFGYLTRSCETLREVFENDVRYLGTRVSCLSAAVHDLGSTTRVEIRSATSLGTAWPIVAEVVLGCLATLGDEFLPEGTFARALSSLVVDVQPLSIHITIPSDLLAIRLRHVDPSLKDLATRALASEPVGPPTTAAAVAELLASTTERALTLEDVARRLAVAPRTLRRKLSADGTSFQQLLDQCREARARHYLLASELTIGEIAARLSFEGASSFCQAFRRWTGVSPGQYRIAADAPLEPTERRSHPRRPP